MEVFVNVREMVGIVSVGTLGLGIHKVRKCLDQTLQANLQMKKLKVSLKK